MIKQVASLGVGVHRHVLFRTGDWTASCNLTQEGPKVFRVQGIAEGKKVWEESDLFLGEVIEGSKITGLVDLSQSGIERPSRSAKRMKWSG